MYDTVPRNMDDHICLRPEEFTVERPALRTVQSVGTETETPRSRLYGLAIEYTAKNRPEFEQYVIETIENE